MVLQAMGEAPAVATTALKEVRSAVTATTMEARLAAITASLNESLALLASSARRLGVKEQQGQEATKASVAPMTGSLFAPDPVCEQSATKPSSPPFISMPRVGAADALPMEAVVTPTLPTRCLTAGLTFNANNNHAVAALPCWGNTLAEDPAPTKFSLDHALQPFVAIKCGMPAPASCLTECRDVLPKQCEVNSGALAGTCVFTPVPKAAVLPATTQPPDKRCTLQEEGAALLTSAPLSVRTEPRCSWLFSVPTRPPDPCIPCVLPVPSRPSEQTHVATKGDDLASASRDSTTVRGESLKADCYSVIIAKKAPEEGTVQDVIVDYLPYDVASTNVKLDATTANGKLDADILEKEAVLSPTDAIALHSDHLDVYAIALGQNGDTLIPKIDLDENAFMIGKDCEDPGKHNMISDPCDTMTGNINQCIQRLEHTRLELAGNFDVLFNLMNCKFLAGYTTGYLMQNLLRDSFVWKNNKSVLAVKLYVQGDPGIMKILMHAKCDVDGTVAVQFESGYFVETLVEGDKLGVTPHTIRVSPIEGGELLAVDSAHSNIVRITPPLSEYSRGRLVAGSFQGHAGHIDGKPIDARFKRPTGVAVDDTGNVYIADTANLAIRKIGESGVTTIAGGKSNIPGYRDGPSEDAKFSTDFDVVYVKKMCSLLVIDRGNAALRKIALPQEDCTYQDAALLSSDIILVIGAVVAGYVFSVVQHGFGPSSSEKIEAPEDDKQESSSVGKPPLVVESLKEEPSAGWPSFGTLVADLLKLAAEGMGNLLLNIVPQRLQHMKRKTGLTPLKDRLVMPEDGEEKPLSQKLSSTPMRSETLHAPTADNEATTKAQKSAKPSKFRDSTLSSKHRSAKRQEYAEFYGSAEAPQASAKVPKDRLRHRSSHREKSGEAGYGAGRPEPRSAAAETMKPAEYSDPKYEQYNMRSKYGADGGGFRY